MSNLEYEEKYGDDGYQLDSRELEEEQFKIDSREILKHINNCVRELNEAETKEEFKSKIRDLKEIMEEI